MQAWLTLDKGKMRILDLNQGRSSALGGHRPVFVAGSARSGTTWLQQTINFKHDHRVVFEPFWTKRVREWEKFRDWQYLRVTDDNPRAYEIAGRILGGTVHNDWVDQFSRQSSYPKTLIKDIRANLLLYWLHARFPQLRIVFIIRHPYSVVTSQLRLGWRMRPKELLKQEELVRDYLGPLKNEIGSCVDDFECNVYWWCIENSIPLRQFSADEIHVVYYEKLLSDPEGESRRLFNFLEYEFEDKVLHQLKQPSRLSVADSAITTGADPVVGWLRHANKQQVSRMNRILRLFELDKIYSDEPMPLVR